MSIDIIIIYPKSYKTLLHFIHICLFIHFTHCYDLFTDDKSTVTKKQGVSLPGTDLCSISVSSS